MRNVLVLAAFAALVFLATTPARAQLPLSTTTSSTASSTTTTAPPTTTTAPPATTTTAKPRPTTTKAPTTTEKATTTIPTPAAVSTTTTTIVPISKHSGHFSPVFSVLAFVGFVGGFGLLVLQWFLTKPGREGWTL